MLDAVARRQWWLVVVVVVMSWESLNNCHHADFVSHQLSATRLLSASPDDDSRHLSTSGRAAHHNTAAAARSSIAAFGCFRACGDRLRARLARRQAAQGERLYARHQHAAAVRKWRAALSAVRTRDDRFKLLGLLYEAHMDCGRYRDATAFAHRQLYVAEELDAAGMRARAHLHLARAHARAGALERALAYARLALSGSGAAHADASTAGRAHLTVAGVHVEGGAFAKALDALRTTHQCARAAADTSLALDAYVALAQLFARLRDADASARYAARAYDMSRALHLGADLNTRAHRAALVQMAAALRQQGELGDAHDYAVEATRLARHAGDQPTYARAIRVMGDIYRRRRDVHTALRHYEMALAAAAAMGDRVLQMEAMDGAARCLEAWRAQRKICACRPLEFNTRLLEVAASVGAKLVVRDVRMRLAHICAALGDDEQRAHHERAAQRLVAELALTCDDDDYSPQHDDDAVSSV